MIFRGFFGFEFLAAILSLLIDFYRFIMWNWCLLEMRFCDDVWTMHKAGTLQLTSGELRAALLPVHIVHFAL